MDRAAAFHVEPSYGSEAADTTAAAHPLLTKGLRAAHPGINGAREALHTLTTSVSRHRTIGLTLRLAPAAAFLCLLVMAAPAGAAPSCGRQVIDDWFDDNRVDRTYPLHCYDDAIELLQPDVRDYSNAEEEITRALQRRGRTVPPAPPPATTDPPPADNPDKAAGPGKKPPKPTTTVVDHPEVEDLPPVAAPSTDDASASSVPIPLIVLSALALLLIAGGCAGYVVRRSQSRTP